VTDKVNTLDRALAKLFLTHARIAKAVRVASWELEEAVRESVLFEERMYKIIKIMDLWVEVRNGQISNGETADDLDRQGVGDAPPYQRFGGEGPPRAADPDDGSRP
jgi:hypothetical protein